MAEKIDKPRGRRGRWLVLAVVLAVGAWALRSRRAARADVGSGWPPARPADADASWLVPGGLGAARGTPDVPTTAAAAPPRAAQAGPAARRQAAAGQTATAQATAPAAPRADRRRPSPRPRTAPPPSGPARSEPGRAEPPAGAAVARTDGSAPGPEFTIKVNTGSMLFHTRESPYYSRTKAQYWFRTADEARAAGFTQWTPRKR